MIGESTPRGTGAQHGAASWAKWFKPYFTMINDGDYNFQSFNYINWDWVRLQASAAAGACYAAL